MCNFRVGQRVVCVDDAHDSTLKKGMLYTVSEVFEGFSLSQQSYMVGLRLKNVAPPIGLRGHAALFFRPVVERNTDISVFTRLLNTTPETVGAE